MDKGQEGFRILLQLYSDKGFGIEYIIWQYALDIPVMKRLLFLIIIIY